VHDRGTHRTNGSENHDGSSSSRTFTRRSLVCGLWRLGPLPSSLIWKGREPDESRRLRALASSIRKHSPIILANSAGPADARGREFLGPFPCQIEPAGRAAASNFAIRRRAPVAQLDRASDFGSEGWRFDSLRARQSNQSVVIVRIGFRARVPAREGLVAQELRLPLPRLHRPGRGGARHRRTGRRDYLSDFKDEVQRVSGGARHHAYFDVWAVMRDCQNAEPL
jgi:hypothetical protein